MNYPKIFENLIYELEKLPGIGQKMAVRIAMKLYRNRFNNIGITENIKSLVNLHTCKLCNSISDTEICDICSSNSRDISKIMIVEDYLDLVSIESSKEFTGFYFIIGGLISPMNGIMPDDLSIRQFIERVRLMASNVNELEIIFSLNPNMEGEGTVYYIKQELDDAKIENVKLSKLALGIPRGADIDFVDSETLKFAFRSRGEL